MYFLFEVDTNQVNPEIKHTDFRQYYPAISPAMSWNNIKPYIRQAYYANILPYIGADLWEVLKDNAAEAEVDQDEELTELTELIKQSLALYAINLGYPELNTHISDGAVTTPSPDKAMPVSQWAFVAARWNLIIRAEKSLDIALDYIIKNNIEWSAGDGYKHTLMNGSTELMKHVRVNGHRAYVSMYPYFDKAVQHLSSVLSCAVMEDIITNIADPDYAAVVDQVKRYVAHYALELAIPRMMVFVEGNSLIFLNNADGIKEGTGVYSKANIEAVQMLLDSCKRDYSSTLDNIMLLMQKDPTTFSLYATFVESQKEVSHVAYTTDPCTGLVVGGVGFF